MSEKEIKNTEAAAKEIFDVAVNPLANMICVFLAFQVRNGLVSKDDAKRVVASSADILNQSTENSYIRDIGAEMLLRMISAIDRIEEPSTRAR